MKGEKQPNWNAPHSHFIFWPCIPLKHRWFYPSLFISPPGSGGYPCFSMPVSDYLHAFFSGATVLLWAVSLSCATPLSADIVGMAFIDSLGFGSLPPSLLPPSSFWATSASTGWPPDALSCLFLDQVIRAPWLLSLVASPGFSISRWEHYFLSSFDHSSTSFQQSVDLHCFFTVSFHSPLLTSLLVYVVHHILPSFLCSSFPPLYLPSKVPTLVGSDYLPSLFPSIWILLENMTHLS